MSDDLNKKIKQITDILGQDTIPDNLKGLLSLLTSTPGKDEAGTKAIESPAPREEKVERADRTDLDENLEMIRKVRKVMDRLNNSNDPRVNLLTAIKPFLNNKRQKKVGDCIRILQMSSLTKLMDDNDKSGSR